MPAESSPNLVRDIPAAVWVATAALIVALAVLVHAVFPRYEYRLVEDGRAMVIYDRWSGRFQRVQYDAAGDPTLTPVLTPF